jgi:hypothetical protein
LTVKLPPPVKALPAVIVIVPSFAALPPASVFNCAAVAVKAVPPSAKLFAERLVNAPVLAVDAPIVEALIVALLTVPPLMSGDVSASVPASIRLSAPMTSRIALFTPDGAQPSAMSTLFTSVLFEAVASYSLIFVLAIIAVLLG